MNFLTEFKKINVLLARAPVESYICGGAPRDIDFGVVPKDIDVFCIIEREDQVQSMLNYMIGTEGCEYIGRAGENFEYEEQMNDIDSVHNFKWGLVEVGPNHFEPGVWDNFIDNRIDIQLVFMRNDRDVLDKFTQITNTFDLGICQIGTYYSGAANRHKILRTEDYKQQKAEGIVRLTLHGKKLLPEQANKTRIRASNISRKLGTMSILHFDFQVRAHEEQMRAYRQAMAQVQNGGMNDWFVMGQGVYEAIQPQAQAQQEVRRLRPIPNWVGMNNAFNLGNGRR